MTYFVLILFISGGRDSYHPVIIEGFSSREKCVIARDHILSTVPRVSEPGHCFEVTK